MESQSIDPSTLYQARLSVINKFIMVAFQGDLKFSINFWYDIVGFYASLREQWSPGGSAVVVFFFLLPMVHPQIFAIMPHSCWSCNLCISGVGLVETRSKSINWSIVSFSSVRVVTSSSSSVVSNTIEFLPWDGMSMSQMHIAMDDVLLVHV